MQIKQLNLKHTLHLPPVPFITQPPSLSTTLIHIHTHTEPLSCSGAFEVRLDFVTELKIPLSKRREERGVKKKEKRERNAGENEMKSFSCLSSLVSLLFSSLMGSPVQSRN